MHDLKQSKGIPVYKELSSLERKKIKMRKLQRDKFRQEQQALSLRKKRHDKDFRRQGSKVRKDEK